jgi:MFS family permease
MTLMLALTWGGLRYAWLSPQIVLLLAASIGLWTLFALRAISATEPFIPLSVLRDGVMRAATGTAFFGMGTVIALTIFLPLYAQVALGLSVSGSAVSVIALQGSATVTSIIGGRLLIHVRRYKRVPTVGLVIAIVALIPLALAPTSLPPMLALGLIGIAGLGLGPTFPFTIVMVQNAVPLHQLGTATGTMDFFRALGSTFIVTAMGALVLTGAPAARGLTAGNSLAGLDTAEAFRWVFAAAALCLAIALACVMLVEERPLRGPATSEPSAGS